MLHPPKLLLCIDDDPDDSQWIQEAAREADPELVYVNKSSGREGLNFLNLQKSFRDLPCLILLDINMPGMNGKETLAAIKKDPELKNIPLIVFSTSNSLRDQAFCDLYGVELITKPQKFDALKRKIHQLVVSRCN